MNELQSRAMPLCRCFIPRRKPSNFSSLTNTNNHLLSAAASSAASSAPRKGRQAVRRLIKLLSAAAKPDLSPALESLRTSPHTLPPSAAAVLVSAAGDPLLSFDFYRFLKSSSNALSRPESSSLFSSLIQTQLRSLSPHLHRIQFYLREMKRLGLSFSAAEFQSLFAPLFPERCELAEWFLHQLAEILGPDSGIYGQAIEIFVNHGLVEDAIQVSERAKREIDNLESRFYSSLMGLLRATSEAKAAVEVFVEMGDRGVLPDEEVYKGLLGILCQVGWMKLSWVVVEEMTKRTGFRLDEGLSSKLMRAFLNHAMVSEAGFLVREGVIKDEESLSAFAETMAEMRMPLEAFQILKSVVVPRCYAAALLRGCAKMGLVEEAEKIHREIKSLKGLKTEGPIYDSMICLYVTAGLRRQAEMVWEEMVVSGCCDANACLHMMSMYGKLRLFMNVIEVFDWWKESGVSLRVEGYVALIEALIRVGKQDEALGHLSDMRSQGIAPNSSIYLLMIQGYLRVGHVNDALCLFEEFKMSKLIIEDSEFASTAAEILISTCRYPELRNLLDGFMRCGIKLQKDKGRVLMQLCRDGPCLRKIAHIVE